jgi:folate-dependent phosphoribosylglycinamide formyltransferase PurN
MKMLVFDPKKSGRRMTIVCFISGSGTNYREIVARNPDHHYLVFTNRPGCAGEAIAREYKHEIIELSHVPYLKEARNKYGPGKVPRNCPERLAYEQEVVRLIENKLGKQPDLICLAGYDQWNTDWFVDRYYPRTLNVHPGDTTKGYIGLHWISAAEAILAGDMALRSTLFFADQTEDNGPVLVQSAPLDVIRTLNELESQGKRGLIDSLHQIVSFSRERGIQTCSSFKEQAGEGWLRKLELVCSNLQDVLKVQGDWKIYPFAVHDLIARGRVGVDGRAVYIDEELMPESGYRLG